MWWNLFLAQSNTVSEKGLNFIMAREGSGPKQGNIFYPYKDVAGNPTIGYGHLLLHDELTSGKIKIGDLHFEYRNGLEKDDVLMILRQDIESTVSAINKLVKVKLTQNQFDALVSFTYNTGKKAFENSNLLAQLNQKKYNSVPVQLLRWVYSGGHVVDGLLNRRKAEANLWSSESY